MSGIFDADVTGDLLPATAARPVELAVGPTQPSLDVGNFVRIRLQIERLMRSRAVVEQLPAPLAKQEGAGPRAPAAPARLVLGDWVGLSVGDSVIVLSFNKGAGFSRSSSSTPTLTYLAEYEGEEDLRTGNRELNRVAVLGLRGVWLLEGCVV